MPITLSQAQKVSNPNGVNLHKRHVGELGRGDVVSNPNGVNLHSLKVLEALTCGTRFKPQRGKFTPYYYRLF